MERRAKRSSTAAVVIITFVAVINLYFVPLGIVLLDELVLGTFYVSKLLPDWCEDLFHIVYWPLIGFAFP